MKRRLRIWGKGLVLSFLGYVRAWDLYNRVAGLDFQHVCWACTTSFDPIDFAQCPRCRIAGNGLRKKHYLEQYAEDAKKHYQGRK